mmetsp:Transcript_32438/g.46776  ORF Transcript_32438/g.46776 Transcript_32438/m.46776 type:complete len:113 (-) Transcript_32438:123-461(-)
MVHCYALTKKVVNGLKSIIVQPKGNRCPVDNPLSEKRACTASPMVVQVDEQKRVDKEMVTNLIETSLQKPHQQKQHFNDTISTSSSSQPPTHSTLKPTLNKIRKQFDHNSYR